MNAKLTPAASRAARGILRWSVRDLAREAGVSPTTVQLLESGRLYRAGTADAVVLAFNRMGVEITNGEGTGARLVAGSVFLERARQIRERILDALEGVRSQPPSDLRDAVEARQLESLRLFDDTVSTFVEGECNGVEYRAL